MRLLVASDLHGSLSSLRFLLDKAKETAPDMVVLLGDLVYHGPRNPLPGSYDTGAMLSSMPDIMHLPCPVMAVRGNCDAEVDVAHMPFQMPETAWIDADGMGIFACHGHHLPDNPPFQGIAPGTAVLRGHTHIPRGETINGVHIWNPGSLSLPKGGFPKTWGLYENGVFHVFDVNDNLVLEHRPARK